MDFFNCCIESDRLSEEVLLALKQMAYIWIYSSGETLLFWHLPFKKKNWNRRFFFPLLSPKHIVFLCCSAPPLLRMLRLFSDKEVCSLPCSEGKTSETCPVLFAGECETRGFSEEAEELGLGLQSPLLALQEKGFLWDWHEIWKSGRRREKKKSCFAVSCACFVNGCCLCLRSHAAPFMSS